jgi:hypothetical protein
VISDFGFWINRTRRKRVFRFGVAALLSAFCFPVYAQQSRLIKIGELVSAIVAA